MSVSRTRWSDAADRKPESAAVILRCRLHLPPGESPPAAPPAGNAQPEVIECKHRRDDDHDGRCSGQLIGEAPSERAQEDSQGQPERDDQVAEPSSLGTAPTWARARAEPEPRSNRPRPPLPRTRSSSRPAPSPRCSAPSPAGPLRGAARRAGDPTAAVPVGEAAHRCGQDSDRARASDDEQRDGLGASAGEHVQPDDHAGRVLRDIEEGDGADVAADRRDGPHRLQRVRARLKVRPHPATVGRCAATRRCDAGVGDQLAHLPAM